MKKIRIIILLTTFLPVSISFSQSPIKAFPDSIKFPYPDSALIKLTEVGKETNYPFQPGSSREVWKSIAVTQLYNATMGGMLLLMPEEISKWNAETKFQWTRIKNQYRSSFTNPPIVDSDLFFINYIGHPYQGAFYYNSLRSKGATMWQSALFNLGNSLLWEYGWEGGMEQPSIQDLITTPIIGSLMGELAHRATIDLKKNGFFWYEKVLVTILNPSYVINNGYK